MGRQWVKPAAMLLIGLAVGIVAGRSIAPPKVTPWVRVETDAGLDRLVSLDATRMPLRKVIDSLGDQSHANILVAWQTLDEFEVKQDEPIDLRLDNIQLRVAIERVLNQAGGGRVQLGFATRDGVIDINARQALDRDTVTRMYDLRDILDKRIIEHNRWPTKPPDGDGNFFNGRTKPGELTAETVVEDVTRLILDRVDSNSWREMGGTSSSIRGFGAHLIVTQTRSNHAEIERVLTDLRRHLK